MFNILKLPSEDSHLEEFQTMAAQAVADGNERDARHWEIMAESERFIAGTTKPNDQEE
jgi:hypothetical protein